MRLTAYLLFAAAVLYAVSNARDEMRGSTTIMFGRKSAAADESAQRFRGAMIVNWCAATALVLLGVTLLKTRAHIDRTAPLTPDR